ncbi:MAG: FeoC-like transcriptional regulator [Suipraeoptans sp.]
MLVKLLRLLEEGRAYSQIELGECLSMSKEAISAQIEYLEHLGMLRRIKNLSGCGSGCKSCGSDCKSDCQSTNMEPTTMWELVPLKNETE